MLMTLQEAQTLCMILCQSLLLIIMKRTLFMLSQMQ